MILQFKLKKSADYIFDYLTDMQKFAIVHPVISTIDKLNDGKYKVHETLKFGFIPISFTYPVTISTDRVGNLVRMNAVVFSLIKIDMVFMLIEKEEYTIVEEDVTFTSVLPINKIMEKTFKEQHEILFANIDTL